MKKKITRRNFIKGMGVALLGATIVPTLGGCGEKPKQKLLVLKNYSEDENKVIATLAEGEHFGIGSRTGNFIDKTNEWDSRPTKYIAGNALILPAETVQEDLEKLSALFDQCNANPSEYSTFIMRVNDEFVAYYFNGFESLGDFSYNLSLEGIDVAKNVKLNEILLIGANKQIYLEPLVAKEYGLEDKREEITGKSLVKTV